MSQTITKPIFTPSQKKAMRHVKDHLCIIACPGSGKTEVVSQRVANLIKNGADPKTIVAFTFTEKAAEEMKNRIRGILGAKYPDRTDSGDMFVGTIHSFCFHMLKELDPAYRSYDILDAAKRLAFVSNYRNFRKLELVDLQKAHRLYPRITIEQFLHSFEIVITENINPAKIRDLKFRRCVITYQKALDEAKYFDFSTVMHKLVEILKKDKEKQKLLGKKVKHVVLDEYQDVNRIQESLLELLAKKADSVCVVGDDDQSIYNWRGADVSIIRNFEKRHGKKKTVTKIHLNTNFRATDALVHATRKFIEHGEDRLPKKMVSNKRLKRKYERGDIVHKQFENEWDEFDFIIRKIWELEGTRFLDKQNRPFSLSLGDFAILVRTNKEARQIASYFKSKKIDHIAYSGESIFDHSEVSFALNCIRYVFRIDRYITWSTQAAGLKINYQIIFRKRLYRRADPDSFVRRLKKLRLEIDKIREKEPRDYLGGRGLQGVYHKILNAMGAESFEFKDVLHYRLAALSQAISDYESVWTRLRASDIEDFLHFIYLYKRSRHSEVQYSDAMAVNAVKILTIHKAKGLEFPAVFVPYFRNKKKPFPTKSFVDPSLYNFDMYNGDEDAERRIYYTAFTRAEKYLFLTSARRILSNKRDVEPHRFRKDIPEKYLSSKLVTRKPRPRLPSHTKSLKMYPTSFSQMSSYSRCPYDFRLRHVYGYNPGVPASFGYGTNIHNALNIIHSDYIRTGKVPTDKKITKMFDSIFTLRYAHPRMAANMKKSSLKIIKNYVKQHKHDFGRMFEAEKDFEFVLDNTLVAGQIDLLKKSDKRSNIVEIVDFKSERADGAYRADYERQLRYYAIACSKSLDLEPKKAYVHHINDGSREDVDISDEHLKETESEIKQQVKDILDGKFKAAPEKQKCTDCDWAVFCSHKKSAVDA